MLARADIRADLFWWPDWRGEPCAILASGPSIKNANVTNLRGRIRVIAIKECAIDLAPWADVAYGCDAAWWRHRRGLPGFKGLKIAWERTLSAEFPDIRLIEIQEHSKSTPQSKVYTDKIVTNPVGVVGGGCSSAFQALNLAVQFGSNRILFVGLDQHDRSGVHYYGRNNWFKAGNPDATQFQRCRRAFEGNAAMLKSMGVDVVNASPISDLKCFRRQTIEKTFEEWGLS